MEDLENPDFPQTVPGEEDPFPEGKPRELPPIDPYAPPLPADPYDPTVIPDYPDTEPVDIPGAPKMPTGLEYPWDFGPEPDWKPPETVEEPVDLPNAPTIPVPPPIWAPETAAGGAAEGAAESTGVMGRLLQMATGVGSILPPIPSFLLDPNFIAGGGPVPSA